MPGLGTRINLEKLISEIGANENQIRDLLNQRLQCEPLGHRDRKENKMNCFICDPKFTEVQISFPRIDG